MFSTSRSAWYWSLIIILGFLGLNTTSFGNQNAPASKSQTKKDNSSKTDLEEKEAPKQTPNNYIRQNIFKGNIFVSIIEYKPVIVPGAFAQSVDRGSDDEIGLRLGFEKRSALGWAKRFVFAPFEVGSSLHSRDISF
jgi:hypothetical protein